jgi:alanyl-tRNA synthetase
MQFDRASDGSMTPLPKPCVDTGMGLERLAAILQGVHNNYDIDLFADLIDAAAELTHTQDRDVASLKVLADHIRACAFLVVDGVLPSNEGRGYVLRRIIRRAIRHGHKLGVEGAFFAELVEPLAAVMGQAYPELVEKKAQVVEVLAREETRFRETLDQGMALLGEALGTLDGGTIPGELAFKLYDTYGFPVDLTRDIARERGLKIDEAAFEKAMNAQRERARSAGSFKGASMLSAEDLGQLPSTEFVGYTHLSVNDCQVVGLLRDGERAEQLQADQEGVIFMDITPFYGESGGQLGDQGRITLGEACFEVTDTQKIAGQFFAHHGRVTAGTFKVNDHVNAVVDAPRRADIVRHHSATHLLHAALRMVLGEHVQQKGSMVGPDRLRFDFSHPEPVSEKDIEAIERWVSERIMGNVASVIEEMPYDEAIASGALAFFGDKYGDTVRVVRFGDYSVELCGGTHVDQMGDIGLFKIVSESGVSSGVRRIEALAGEHARQHLQHQSDLVRSLTHLLKTEPDALTGRVSQLLGHARDLEKELERLKNEAALQAGDQLLDQAADVAGIQVLAAEVGDLDADGLRTLLDQLKNKLGSAVVVLGSRSDGAVRLVAGVTQDLTATLKAGDLIREVASMVGGKGGGRPDFAQAGGPNPEALPQALASVQQRVQALQVKS